MPLRSVSILSWISLKGCKKDGDCKCLKHGRRGPFPFTGKCDIPFGKYKTCNCDCGK